MYVTEELDEWTGYQIMINTSKLNADKIRLIGSISPSSLSLSYVK